LITTYRSDQQQAVPLSIQIAALGRTLEPPAAVQAPGDPAPDLRVAPPEATVAAEITFCIDQVKESKVVAGAWVGTPGSQRFWEAFGIVPHGAIERTAIEYKGLGPNGRETPWVSGGKLCGSRGKNVALTGFAVRLAEHIRDKFDVVYEGAFMSSGNSGPRRNGEPCRGAHGDDPLEALSLAIIPRV
jgi:hypothetical protein